jgi:hypothetical protein
MKRVMGGDHWSKTLCITLPIESRLEISTTDPNVNFWEPLQCYEHVLALRDFVFYLFHNEQTEKPNCRCGQYKTKQILVNFMNVGDA